MTQTPLSPTLDFLRRHAPFEQMAPAHLEYLAKRLKLGFYAKGEVIVGPESGPAGRFFIIKQGRVRGESDKMEGGDGAWELVAGECFPIGALLSRRPVRLTQRAVEDTFCFELERDELEQLLAKSPVFHDFCTRRIASLLDNALKGVQASSVTRVSEDALNTPLASLVRRTPITCAPDAPLRFVLRLMDHERIGSMVVVDADERPLGIFTLHDVLGRVALPGLDLATPIAEVMTRDPLGLPPTAFAYEAARVMVQHGVGHVCIVDDGRLAGVLSERDLFSLQRVGLVSLSRAISRADSVATLALLERDVHRLVEQMLAQGASVEQLMQIMTTLNDQITRRAIALCEAELGVPEVPYTWLSFGSEGRFEQTLKTDQDNGILFIAPPDRDEDEVRAALLPLAKRINEALAEIGFPLCRGNIMASNPECCLSFAEWQRRFAQWIEEGSAQHLLNATIFFDFRALYGDEKPADELRVWLGRMARDHRAFLRRMVENALRNRPPLGLMRDFVVQNAGDHPHTIDLKTNGITPFVDAARIFALAAGIAETATVARLREAGARWQLDDAGVEGWVQGFLFVQLLRLRQQHNESVSGQPLSNHVDPDQLNDLDRRILKEAFRQSRKLQSRLETFFQF